MLLGSILLIGSLPQLHKHTSVHTFIPESELQPADVVTAVGSSVTATSSCSLQKSPLEQHLYWSDLPWHFAVDSLAFIHPQKRGRGSGPLSSRSRSKSTRTKQLPPRVHLATPDGQLEQEQRRRGSVERGGEDSLLNGATQHTTHQQL